MLLAGRTAIVYGASGAVGRAVVSAFVREGAKVVLSARRREPLDQVAMAIGGSGGLTDVMTVDATDPIAIQQHLHEVVHRHGPVSLMFNAVSWDDVQGQVLSEMSFDAFFAPVRVGLTTWFHTGTALAVAGERDQNAHLSTIIAAYYMIPNSQLAIIPNATHTVFLENFPAVWASIRPFLE